MSLDPCESCQLRDCDDSHPDCPLRQALRDYYALMRKRELVPNDVRRRKNLAYQRFYGGDRSARRPHRRNQTMMELSETAYRALRGALRGPYPTQETNPGVVRALMTRGYVEVVDLPSPYRSHKRTKTVPHLRITEAGKAILEGI